MRLAAKNQFRKGNKNQLCNLLKVGFLLELRERCESVLPTDDANHDGRLGGVRIYGAVRLHVLLQLCDHPLDRLGRHLGAHVAVKGRR